MDHIVESGECLSSIAHHYGLPHWRTIYDHPNNAAFKAKRPNPNLIYPGDLLYIPDPARREEKLPSDKRHIFTVDLPPTYINIRIQDLAKEPIANARYQLTMEAMELSGPTDDDGWIRGEIPAWAEYGQLQVWPNDDDPETVINWTVKLGHLNPLDTVSGIKGRLNNLGYYCGEVNDIEDELYDDAVRRFQEDHGLVVDGIAGPATRGRLDREHRV